MTITAEDRRPRLVDRSPRPWALCPADGARLHDTIVGPRCPICGTAGAR